MLGKRVRPPQLAASFIAVPPAHMSSNSGALVAATEGSTKPVTMTVTNAGLATVETFDLRVP